MPDATTQKSSIATTVLDQMRVVIQHADDLESLVRNCAGLPPALSPSAVIRKLEKSTGIEFSTLRALFNALDNLNTLKNELGDADKAIDKVGSLVGRDNPLPGLEENKAKIVAAMSAYSDDNPIAISLKAQRLLYLHSLLFVDAEIITDARPVFDSKGEKVLEYVVGNSLVVTYHQDEGDDQTGRHNHSRIHVAMDMGDILKLRAACDRALLKSKSLHTDLGERGRVLGDYA